MKSNQKGFTLIELLAVIVILGIIFMIVMPNFIDVINGTRTSLNNEQKKWISSYFKEKSKQNTSTFKAIYEKHKLENEKNPKVMLDDYVKFIRFAQSKIDSQESGIFAFISNNSFLDNPTFRGMRYSLMQSFDKIYILNFREY